MFTLNIEIGVLKNNIYISMNLWTYTTHWLWNLLCPLTKEICSNKWPTNNNDLISPNFGLWKTTLRVKLSTIIKCIFISVVQILYEYVNMFSLFYHTVINGVT